MGGGREGERQRETEREKDLIHTINNTFIHLINIFK